MDKLPKLLAGLIGFAVCFAVAAQPTLPAVKPVAPVPTEKAGMTVYVDPVTGVFLKEPAPGHVPLPLSPQLQNAQSTSHEGLVETPGSVQGGGVKIDLKGRFRSPLIVTTDVDGKVKTQHLTEPPKSTPRD